MTRKSTNGHAAMFGQHALTTGSHSQSVVGLSSAESEYYALTKGGSIGLGLRSLALDWGITLDVRLHGDNSSALSLARRRGVGTMRHIQSKYLWLQDLVARKELQIYKVGTHQNIANMFTKAVSASEIDRTMKRLNYEFRDGRASLSKQLINPL